MPPTTPAVLLHDASTGLRLRWTTPQGLAVDVPVRVTIEGAGTFLVWGAVDSGEGAPAWAEPEFRAECFGPTKAGAAPATRLETITRDGGVVGYRAFGLHERVTVELEVGWQEPQRIDSLRFALRVHNPQGAGGQRLPLCRVELRLADFALGPAGTFLSAHAYGGRTHGYGRLADLVEPGMPFHHGAIGLALPLVYLHDHAADRGIEFEFMLDGRPTAWVRPGTTRETTTWAVNWTTERLLLPGQAHAYGGTLRLRGYAGDPVQQLRDWRDSAASRYGIRTPPRPDWLNRRSCIELWLNPGAYKEFTRHDDPALRAMLERWRSWGYNAIMAVAPNPFGKHPLSPFHYRPNEATGGLAAEKTMLDWMHELRFHVGIWFTTVGLDKAAPEVASRRDWWTHRPNQELFYAWDSNAANGFVGYAPDGDPGSTGWRRFMLEQLADLLARGWNGVFIDGCIPRASNHARWFWPGEARTAVEDQATELAETIRRSGADAILVNEDAGLLAQATADVSTGRYTPMVPYFKKAYWDHGMGGGPKELGEPPPRIPPEMVRNYLLVRYGSLLPDAISEDGVEGYLSEEGRPWTVCSVLSGPTTFKTHAEYVNDPLTFRPMGDAPPPGPLARDPAHRQRGHEEFLRLLKLREQEPLVHANVPLSIEAVHVEGDEAVVGLLRPTAQRCLLILVQFADRPATVRVRLAAPVDVPAPHRAAAGAPERATWQTKELLRSIREERADAPATLGPDVALTTTLGPYGFRVLELQRD